MNHYLLTKSKRKDKKLALITPDNKTINFGAVQNGNPMSDYTQHKDPERKQRYLNRHKKENDMGLWKGTKTNLNTPSYLSKNLLWNQPSLDQSIKDIEKRLHIKIIKKLK